MNTKGVCRVDTCERGVYVKKHSLCNAHYQAFLKWGTPTPKHMDPEARFFERVDRTGECWVWTGYEDQPTWLRNGIARLIREQGKEQGS